MVRKLQLDDLTFYDDCSLKYDEGFFCEFRSSPRMEALQHRLSDITNFAGCLPGSFRRRLNVYCGLACAQVRQWKSDGSACWITRGETTSIPTVWHGATYLTSWIITLYQYLVMDIIALRLKNYAFNSRSLPGRARMVFQLWALIRYRYKTARLIWTFLVERQTIFLIIAFVFSAIASNASYAHLQDDLGFKTAVGCGNLLLQLVLSYPFTTWRKFEAYRSRRTGLSSATVRELRQHLETLEDLIDELHLLSDRYEKFVSRGLAMQLSALKSDLEAIRNTLRDALPIEERKSRIRHPRSRKLAVWVFTCLVGLVQCGAYWDQPLLLVSVASNLAFTLIVIGDKVIAWEQSPECVLFLFADLMPGNVLSIVFTALPIMLGKYVWEVQTMHTASGFWTCTILHIVANLTLPHHFGPFIIRRFENWGWVPKREQASQVERRLEEGRGNGVSQEKEVMAPVPARTPKKGLQEENVTEEGLPISAARAKVHIRPVTVKAAGCKSWFAGPGRAVARLLQVHHRIGNHLPFRERM